MSTQVGEAVVKLTFDANTKELNATLEKTETSIKKSATSMQQKQDKAFKSVEKGAVVAGAALGVFTKTALDVGINFDSAMSKVQAISGATGDDLQKLRDKAKEMGSATKFTASESAEALTYMAMAGWKTNDMLDGLEGIMNLAAASGEDLATTSDIVTDALTAFGYKASDSARFADVLAKAASNSNTNVAMMGETFKYAAPLAGALGYQIEDVALASGLMANAGIKASQAGTSLRGIFTRLASPPKEAAKAMDALGISLTDSDGRMKSLYSVINELRASFSGLDEVQKTQYASAIAGKTAMSGLLAIVNASEADYDKLTYAVFNANGASKEMAKTMLNNTGGAITLLKSKFEGLQLEIAEKLAPALNGLIEGLSGLVTWLSQNQWVFPVITAGISSILILGLGAKVASFITTLMSLNPWVLAIIAGMTALAGVATFVVSNWEGITQFFGDIVKNVGDFFAGMWEGVCAGAKGAWDFITGLFGNLASFFGSVFSKAWNAVKAVFSVGGKIFGGIVDGIAKVFKGVVNGIIKGINSVVASPFNAINGVLGGLRGIDIIGIKPFGWLPNIGVPKIPLLAQGGYASGATGAVIGEAGKEVVLPLERNTDNWAGLLASTLSKQMEEGNSGRSIVVNMTNQINNEMDAEDIGRKLMQSIRRAS